MAITNEQFMQGLYIAYWGRPADPEGFYYWSSQQGTLGFAGIAENFAASEEGMATYPYFKAFYTLGAAAITEVMRADFVEQIYQNLFNRAADAEGKAYWIAQLTSGASTPGAFIANIVNAAVIADADDAKTLINKADAGAQFTNLLVQNGQTWTPALSDQVEAIIVGVDKDSDMTAVSDSIEDAFGGGSVQTYTLTNGTDNAQANVFISNQVYTPGGDDRINSLQDEDILTGTGDNPTLNATLGNANDNGAAVITPKLIGIETVNVAFTGSGAGAVNTLDMQDSTGTAAVNVTRISDPNNNVTIDNLTTVPAALSLTNTNSPAGQVAFTFTDLAARGVEDVTTMTMSNVVLNNLVIQEKAPGLAPDQGIETINLVSSGSDNRIGTLWAEDLKTLNISGATDLMLGNTNVANRAGTTITEATRYIAGLANVAGSLTAINTADFEGKLTLHLGAEIDSGLDNTSGLQAQLTVTGGKADDTFVLTAGANVGGAVGNTDIIDGKEGSNKMIIVGGATVAAATTPNVKGIQNLEIRTGHDDAGLVGGVGIAEVADVVTINANAFDVLANIYVRNEGMGSAAVGAAAGANWVSKAEAMTVNLNNLTEAQAKAITLAHGSTGNSTIANNIINVTYRTAGTANEAQVTLVDGINNDPVFNAQLNLVSAEKVTLVDNDTESNTIHLADATRTQAGSTLTILPGEVSDAGKYMNLDSSPTGALVLNDIANAPGNDFAARAGYGITTNGTSFSNTIHLDRESAEQVTANNPALRDAAASSVFFGTAGVAADGVTRHTFENIVANTYAGDVIVRLADITRADGTSSMNIATGSGNDTFIFDAIGVTNAGFTSGDTIKAGTGTDTLVIDGNTTTTPGTPRINHQTSEWDNLTGIDVLRFANNAGVANVGNGAQVANAGGGYYAAIDNDFISQTDAGNRLTVINNDGSLMDNSESDLVLDLRGLSQSKWVTFIGANANGAAGLSSNRLVVDDVSANQNMILDGGDTDVRNLAATNWVGYVAGNNNVYEVRNTANVSISDLSQTKNFGLINFTNNQATAQTLTLTLNNTVVEAMVDNSRTATNAATQEIMNVVANDQGAVASALNVDARAVDGFRALNIVGSVAGNDVITLNSNVGGTAHDVFLEASTGDRVNWTGTATTVTVELGTNNGAVAGAGNGWAQFQTGAVTTVHDMDGVEIIDITGMTYTNSFLNGTNAAETIIGGNGIDVITGGAGVDVMTGNGGVDTFVFDGTAGATTSGGVLGNFDSINDFVIGTDKLQFTNAVDVVSAQQAAVQAAVTALGAGATAAQIATAMATANTTALGVSFAVYGGNTYAYFERTAAGVGVVADDVFIQLTGVNVLPTFAGDVIA